jgi:hypothetical protein
MRLLGAALVLGLAFLTALVTMSLLGLGCGENKDPCTATSGPVLAVLFSWAGFVGVLASLVLARSGFVRVRAVAVVATTVAYVAWLVFLVQEP